MSLIGQHIAVVGAGIGGLACARALALRGASVTVLEQAPEIAEVGAGLQVSPNGMAVLRAIGLEDELRATGAPRAEGVTLRNRNGGVVARMALDGLKRPEDYLFVHRADLIDVLAQGARQAGVRINLLQHVAQIDPGPRPCVRLSQGARVQADLVVAADGLHSSLMTQLNPGAEPFFTGQVAWRALFPGDGGPAEAEVFMGPGRHLVTYPLRGGAVRNIVAVEERRSWVEARWSQKDDPDNLRAAFAGMGPAVRGMLDDVRDVHLWGLFRHEVAAQWTGENVALLGDAAHPTLPFLAQGASMALEDAWVLADSLSRADDAATGLALYQSRRRDRARRVIGAANGNAWKYHLRGPFALGAHMGMRMIGTLAPSAISRSFSWLYDHDVTEG